MTEYSYLSPEKVYLKLNLAGVGARFVAYFIDSLVQGLLVFFIFICGVFSVVATWSKAGKGLEIAIGILLVAVIALGYYIYFETVWNGQTPGKRFVKLRVVQENGSAVTFSMVLIRNLLRMVDVLPVSYAIGIVAVFLSKKNQRLGDMAAGTVVIREIGEEVPVALNIEVTEAPLPGVSSINARKISEADFAVLKKYLLRRGTIPLDEIPTFENKLTRIFCQKLGIDPEEITNPTEFIRQVAVLASQGTSERQRPDGPPDQDP